MIPTDLETLREIMKDKRVWVAIGKITRIEFASNRSGILVKVLLFPDSHEIVAKIGVPSVAPDAGDYGPLSVNDMALIAIPEGLEDYAHVICRLPSDEDKVPQQVIDGDSFSKSKSGKRNILWGDTKAQIIAGQRINLAKSDADVTEPLILGLVMQQAYEKALLRLTTLIDKMIAGPMVMGNLPGFPCPTHDDFITELNLIKDDIADDKDKYSTDPDTNFLSQLSFTERGGE